MIQFPGWSQEPRNKDMIQFPGWAQEPGTTTTGESSTSHVSNEISCIVNDVFETLKDDKMYMIGIHGVNRADMIKLVSTIYMRADDESQFEDVAIAVDHDERKMQDEMAYCLGLKFDSNIDFARRYRLYKRLADKKKKLIILGDVCEVLNLEAIGIVPFEEGEGNATCKIIVTSSDKSICEKMSTQKNYKLVVHEQMLLFGGHSGGVLWDDKAHTTIRSIIVAYNAMGICSFQTEYDDNGHWSRSSNHEFANKSTHDKEEKIELRYPDEFLISVSGCYISESNQFVLRSLKFESNKHTFGPFGPETGEPFTSSPEAGKIIGFYGRTSHASLDALGYYYDPISSPTGPQHRTLAFGSKEYDSFDDGRYTAIRKLEIYWDTSSIDSIRIEYDSNGRSRWSDVHGIGLNCQKQTVHLDYPGEFIISVSGHATLTWIQSLTIETNRKKYGPFGKEKGKAFSFPSIDNSGKIVGFHGNCSAYLYSLGAYIEPFPTQNPTTSFGPVGGDGGGTHWDDGAAHTTIRQIKLWAAVDAIAQIETEYDKNGRSEWGAARRGFDLANLEVLIKLDYPSEFLISMSGTTRALEEKGISVSSLKFQSNRRTYGPYGTHIGDPFSTSPSTSGKIVGLHGRSDSYLHAIGAHFEPFLC